MLEAAAAQRTKSTPKKAQQPKFQFHVNKELQKHLQISTNKTYSAATQQTSQKKKLMIVQPQQQQLQSIIRQQQPGTAIPTPSQTQGTSAADTATQQMELNEHGMGIPREEWEEIAQRQGIPRTRMITNAMTQEARTIATNNSGLSVDQQTITTMMTQITQQFKEMERERITREERQEMKRQERETKAEEKREEREARIEEKRMDAQKEMYAFMQTMMTMNQSNRKDNVYRKEPSTIPDELTTGTTEQTSALTTSITTSTTNTPTGKRASSLLSNTNEETEMTDKETETETEENVSVDDNISIKRNKKLTDEADEEDDNTVEVEEMIIENEQETTKTNGGHESADETMTDTGSFTAGFFNQQFQTTTSTASQKGATQQ
jgi:hypothetical protein